MMRKPEYCKHGTSIAFFCEVCANDEIAKLRAENSVLRDKNRRLWGDELAKLREENQRLEALVRAKASDAVIAHGAVMIASLERQAKTEVLREVLARFEQMDGNDGAWWYSDVVNELVKQQEGE